MRLRPLVCTAAVLLAAACTDSAEGDPVRLQMPGDPAPFGMTMSGTTAHRPYTFTAIPLCLTGPGRARILGADVVGARNGLRIHAFGVQPWERTFPGNAYRPLWRIGYQPGAQVVDRACSQRRYVELGLEFRRVGVRTASGEAVRLRYRSNGQTLTVTVPFAVTLCARSDTDTGHCMRVRPDPHARRAAARR